jgi:hypothetical protein
MCMACANILQAGAIITTRIIMILATVIISKSGDYFQVWPCAKIESTLPDVSAFLSNYPECAAYVNGTNPNLHAIVVANLDGETGANAGAALSMSFGMALWVSTVMHAIGVEIYVCCHHSIREATRLTQSLATSHAQGSATSPTSQLPTATRGWHAEPWIRRPDFRPARRHREMDACGCEETKHRDLVEPK